MIPIGGGFLNQRNRTKGVGAFIKCAGSALVGSTGGCSVGFFRADGGDSGRADSNTLRAVTAQTFDQPIELLHRAELNRYLACALDFAVPLDAFFNPHFHYSCQQI